MTLDEMGETFWDFIGQRPHLEIGGAFACVLREHILPVIAQAHCHGEGNDIPSNDDYAYAERVIATLTDPRAEAANAKALTGEEDV